MRDYGTHSTLPCRVPAHCPGDGNRVCCDGIHRFLRETHSHPYQQHHCVSTKFVYTDEHDVVSLTTFLISSTAVDLRTSTNQNVQINTSICEQNLCILKHTYLMLYDSDPKIIYYCFSLFFIHSLPLLSLHSHSPPHSPPLLRL